MVGLGDLVIRNLIANEGVGKSTIFLSRDITREHLSTYAFLQVPNTDLEAIKVKLFDVLSFASLFPTSGRLSIEVQVGSYSVTYFGVDLRYALKFD